MHNQHLRKVWGCLLLIGEQGMLFCTSNKKKISRFSTFFTGACLLPVTYLYDFIKQINIKPAKPSDVIVLRKQTMQKPSDMIVFSKQTMQAYKLTCIASKISACSKVQTHVFRYLVSSNVVGFSKQSMQI